MVESLANKVSYEAKTGEVYTFPYPFFEAYDLVCYLTDSEQGETLLVSGRDYTVIAKESYADGGEIKLLVTVPKQSVLTIMRVLSLKQMLNLPEFGKIPSAPVEQNFDRIVMMIQQLKEILDRVITGSGVSGNTSGSNYQKFFAEFMAQYMLTGEFADAVVRIISTQLADKNSLFSQRVSELVDEFSKPFKFGLRKLFDVFWGFSKTTPVGAVDLSLGATLDKWTYPDFYMEAIRRADLGAIPVVSEAEYLARLEEFGECPAFVINRGTGTVRLPKIISQITPGDPGELIREVTAEIPAEPGEEPQEITLERRKAQLRLYIQVNTGALFDDTQTAIDSNSENIINRVGLGVDVNGN